MINGTDIEMTVPEAAAVSPAVALQLSVDACTRSFTALDSRIDGADISAFSRLLFGGDPLSTADAQPLALLFQQLWNSGLELAFHPLPDCGALLSNAFSLFSVDALDALLSEGRFLIESEEALVEALVFLGPPYFPLLRHVEWTFLSVRALGIGLSANPSIGPIESVWAGIRGDMRSLLRVIPPGFTSVILDYFPPLFAEFHDKRFSLLWRGGRDGFTGKIFHRRCDGHMNTLLLIQDTERNVFGGFTPLMWESLSRPWEEAFRPDPSLRSFIFTLKNPHNFPPRKFALRAEEKGKAIHCNDSWGPYFRDMCVSDNCHFNRNSSTTLFGTSYTNDTGMRGSTFFTGSQNFMVNEIEVFEITN